MSTRAARAPRPRRRRVVITISFATFLRAIGAAALVWAWLLLWRWVLVFVVATFLAVALDPAVGWLERRGVRRQYASPLVVLLIALLLGGALVMSGASLAQDLVALKQELAEVRDKIVSRVPEPLRQAGSAMAPSESTIGGVAGGLITGLTGVGVALVVTVYLLLDGRRTLAWLIAFVPARSRPRARETAECARRVIASYIHGNLITSGLAAVATWIALVSMGVPAALLLALLAGLLDLVPVVGFFLSAAPAILLGATVSPMVALGVALFFVAYNLVENYYIQPKVYGREMELSALAVIVAFLVGGTLGGVLGALIALPLAAMYPAVERIWFDTPSGSDAVDEHQRIRAMPER